MKQKLLILMKIFYILVFIVLSNPNSGLAYDRQWITNMHCVPTYDKCKGSVAFKILLQNRDSENNGTQGMLLSYRDKLGVWKGITYTYQGGNGIGSNAIKLDGIWLYVNNYPNMTFLSYLTDIDKDDFANIEWRIPDDLIIGGTIDFKITGNWWFEGKVVYINDMFSVAMTNFSAPRNMSAKATCKTVALSWTNTDFGCGTFWCVDLWKGNTMLLDINSPVTTTFTDNVELGQTYNYAVRNAAFLTSGAVYRTDLTNIVVTTTPKLESLAAPTLSQTKCGEVSVQWTTISTAKTYEIQRKLSGATVWTSLKDGLAFSPYTDNTVDAGKTYLYKVIAKSDCETGASSEVSYTTISTAIAPTGFTAIYDAISGITLKWAYPTDANVKFILKKDGTVISDNIDYGKRSYVDVNYTRCTEYKYTLEAKTLCNIGPSTACSIITPSSVLPNINLMASDGKYPNRVELKWNKVNGSGSYKISRDNQLLTTINDEATTSYLDNNVVPGDIYSYKIEATSNCASDSKSVSSSDVGFVLPNGKLTGHIQTQSSNYVEGVEVSVEPTLGKSLEISNKAYIKIDKVPNLSGDELTVEYWFKGTAAQSIVTQSSGTDYIISGTNKAHALSFDGGTGNGIAMGNVTDGTWHYVAFTWKKNTTNGFCSYLDGEIVAKRNSANVSIPFINDSLFVGTNKTRTDFMSGVIDELRIWKVARTAVDIKRDYVRTLNGTETGLFVYLRFDEGILKKAYDFTTADEFDFHGTITNGGNWLYNNAPIHTSGFTDSKGNFVIDKVNYGGLLGQTFNIVPAKARHEFTPKNLQATLDPNHTVLDRLDFTDISTFPVTGTIKYANTLCYETGKEILMDGKSATPPAVTDKNGFFSLSAEMGKHTFSLKLDTIISEYKSYALHTNGSDQFINAGKINLANRSFTIEYWYKKDIAGTKGMNVSQGTGNNYLAAGFKNKDLFIFKFYNDSVVTAAPDDNLWHHWACVYDYTTKYKSIYCDGKLLGSKAGKIEFTDTNSELLLGKNNETNSNGTIDELRIWNTARSLKDIYDNYDKQVSGSDENLIVYYNFDENKGESLKDLSSIEGNNNATVKKPQWVGGAISANAVLYGYNPVNSNYNPTSGVYSLFVDMPKLNMDFDNITRYKLSGKISGRCDFSLGLSDVTITSTPSCIDTTIVGVGTNFEILLPPLTYNVVARPHDKTIVIPSQSVSLTSRDTALVFTYRSPLIVNFAPSYSSLASCGDKIVLKQLERDTIAVSVYEEYGINREMCPVENATITVIDDIAGNASRIDTIRINNKAGTGKWITRPAFPNISGDGEHAYQKKIQFTATDDNNRMATAQYWAYITGARPRANTFTTRMPVSPFLILRDPPGDGSYSYWEKETSHTTGLSISKIKSRNDSKEVQLSLLPKFESTAGTPFFSTGTELEPIVKASEKINYKETTESTDLTTITFTSKERFQTNDMKAFVGEDQDMFIGGAYNISYAASDNVAIVNCTPQLEKGIALHLDSISTFFLYTSRHIQDYVIPGLIELRDDSVAKLNAKGEFSKANSVYKSYTNDSTAWMQMLADNQRLKDEAKFEKNISFSYGTIYEASQTSDTTKTLTSSSETEYSNEGLLEVGFYANGAGGQANLGYETVKTEGTTSEKTDQTSTTIGYVLKDINPGDYHSVNIYKDQVYKTPVFKTVGGATMCPWEVGTRAREGVALSVLSNSELTNVPADQAAVFRIGMVNTSMTEEAENFLFSILNVTNPDGAIVKHNGLPMSGTPSRVFLPEFGKTQQATVTVERGPEKYDYNNIQLVMYSDCEFEYQEEGAYSNRDGHKTIDTVSISVHFTPPCVSNLSIMEPAQNWVLNQKNHQNNNDILDLFYRCDDMKNVLNSGNVSKIRFEYAPVNGNDPLTVEGGEVKPSDITLLGPANNNYAHLPIKMGTLDEGNYKIRLKTICNNDTWTATDWINGSFFYTPPQVLGTPQPMDGVLSPNDYIQVDFDKNIVGTAIRPHNARLYGILSGTTYKPVSLKFDGVNDYAILCNDSASTEFYQFGDTTDFSVDLWIKVPTAGWKGRVPILTNKDFSSNFNQGFALYGSSDGKTLAFNVADGTDMLEVTGGAFADDNWHYITMTVQRPKKNSTATQLSFYVDLKLVATKTSDKIGNLSTDLPLMLSQDGTQKFTNYFRGNLDEVRLWAKVTGKNISTWKTTLIGNEPNLVANWRLDAKGSKPATFGDITGTFPEGELFNGAVWDTISAAPIESKQVTEEIPVIVSSYDNKIILQPNIEHKWVENAKLTAQVSQIKDQYGNKTGKIEWNFYVDQNMVQWEVADKNIVKYADSTSTFTVQLINSGANTESFKLENLPEWLSADVTEGSLTTYNSKAITFNVLKQLSYGSYQATVNARTLNGWEPLNINLNVICAPPSQNFDPSGYEYFVPLTAKINIDGLVSADPLDIIYAYVGNDLRGVGNVAYSSQVKDYLLFMNLYGNTTAEENFTFKIWSAKNCLEYFANDMKVNFATVNSLGSPTQPIIIANLPLISKSYRLSKGWNWVSFNASPGYSDFGNAAYFDGVGGLIQTSMNETVTNYSFEFWYKPLFDNTTNPQTLVSLGGNNQVSLRFNADKLDLLSGSTTAPVTTNTTVTIERGVWQHLSVTWDGATIRIYKNGEPAWEKAVGCNITLNSLYFGKNINMWADEFRVFNKTLTASDIKSNYLKHYGLPPSGLVLYYDFADLADGKIKDLAGKNYHGTMVDGAVQQSAYFAPPFSLADYIKGDFSADDLMKSQTLFSQHDGGLWQGSLKTINPEKGYMLKTAKDILVELQGQLVSPKTPVVLDKGWNWIGYPANVNAKVEDVLASVLYNANDNDVIKGHNEFAIFSKGNGWVGSLKYMEPGKGYMMYLSNLGTIKMKSNNQLQTTALTFDNLPQNENMGQYNADRLNTEYSITNSTGWQLNGPEYQFNANMVANLYVDGKLNIDSTVVIGAFVNGDCRGFAQPMKTKQGHTYFLTMFGNSSGENVGFKVLINNKLYEATESLVFEPNQVYGSVSQPYSVHIDVQTVSGIAPNVANQFTLFQNNPNPFNERTTVNFSLSSYTDVKLELFDVLGKRVKILAYGKFPTGNYETDINGSILKSGIYFCVLRTSFGTKTIKISKIDKMN